MVHKGEVKIIEFKTRARVTRNIECVSRQKLKRADSTDLLSLSWQNCYPAIPVESESALLHVLLPWGGAERGMMIDHPPHRVQKIRATCSLYGIQLEQALSLRRHHIKLNNPQVNNMVHLGLGNSNDIYDSEILFKSAVQKYLKNCCVPFEKMNLGENMAPAPDFRLTSPVRLIAHQPAIEDCGFGEHGQINWIEAKMCYGTSTISSETSDADGVILSTAKRYVENYGPGAFIFVYGCGSKLRGQLRALRISVLDSHPLNLRKMKMHQKKWCANKDGVILP